MELEKFLENQAADGSHDSAGSFTLDLAKAADKLAAFALPSHAHYLLKFVQVAHHLHADLIKIKIERYRTVIRFKAPSGGPITDSEAIYQAFCDPLVVTDPVMIDLVSGLIGTITEENLETLWSYSEGHSGRRLFINAQRRFSIEDFTLSQPKEPDDHPFSFTLSVLHPRTWKFWLGGRRRAAAAKVLEDNCRFSGVKIEVDSRELAVEPSAKLIAHTRLRVKTHDWENEAFFSTQRDPASTILYQMAEEKRQRFSIMRPSLSAYVVRDKSKNLWAQGTRVNNTLVPDGQSSAAWSLQFLQEGEEVSMRYAPKRVPCMACLACHIDGKHKDLPLRIKLIRSGVTVLEQSMDDWDERLAHFRGCTLMLADHTLETDLTGLQVIQDEKFLQLIEKHVPLVHKAKVYFEQARSMLTM